MTAPSGKRPLTAGNACEILGHMKSVASRVYDGDECVADVDVSYTYDARGNVQSAVGNGQSAVLSRFLFQGREYSFATGLYNFRARWYDPATGRWLSKDPIGLEGGLNLYAFCANNPVTNKDPNGTISGVEIVMAGLAIGLAVKYFMWLKSWDEKYKDTDLVDMGGPLAEGATGMLYEIAPDPWFGQGNYNPIAKKATEGLWKKYFKQVLENRLTNRPKQELQQDEVDRVFPLPPLF